MTSQTGPSRSFAYDSDGRMTSRGSDTISWDGWDRISGGSFSGTTVSYSYDAAGDLRSRSDGTTTLRYLDAGGGSPVFETNPSGTISTSYVDGPGGTLATYSGAPTTSSTVGYRYYNGHGDLAATADASGTRTANYTYDAFGALNGTLPSDTTTQRWTGGFDKQTDTSSGLILMGARPYDPSLGRFLETDPITGGSLNNYDYAGQDPITGYDLSGTMTGQPGARATAGIAYLCGPTGRESCAGHGGTATTSSSLRAAVDTALLIGVPASKIASALGLGARVADRASLLAGGITGAAIRGMDDAVTKLSHDAAPAVWDLSVRVVGAIQGAIKEAGGAVPRSFIQLRKKLGLPAHGSGTWPGFLP